MIEKEFAMPDPDRDDKYDRKDQLDEAVDTFIESTDEQQGNPAYLWLATIIAVSSLIFTVVTLIVTSHTSP